VNIHGTRTTGEKPFASTPLIVRIDNPDPWYDFACLYGVLEVSCMPKDEPIAESVF
jgi:hypothetical protein